MSAPRLSHLAPLQLATRAPVRTDHGTVHGRRPEAMTGVTLLPTNITDRPKIPRRELPFPIEFCPGSPRKDPARFETHFCQPRSEMPGNLLSYCVFRTMHATPWRCLGPWLRYHHTSEPAYHLERGRSLGSF